MRKRTLLTVSAVFAFLLLFALAVFAGAEETTLSGTCGETATWRFEEETGTLYIEGSGAIADYSTEEPAPWSEYKENIEDIIFADEITSAGELAFNGLEELKHLDLNNINTLSSGSFANCTQLEKLLFTASIRQVKMENVNDIPPFIGCDNVSTVTFEEGITKVPQFLCGYLNNLHTINWATTITSIDLGAFAHCQSITELSFPDNIKEIYALAFIECSGLKTINLNKVEKIYESSFSYCSSRNP